MSKKDFKDNPALQFISGEDKPKTTYKGKSETLEERLAELRELIPEGLSLELKSEPRSKRLQLVITPTMQRRLRSEAEAAGLSVNEYVIRAIEAAFDNGEE